jgi:toxin YoeB
MYRIDFTDEALDEASKLSKSAPHTYKKLGQILKELEEHPYTGTGHPKLLKHHPGTWARKLDKKNRILYTITERTITVYVISVIGHYDDK